MEVNASIRNSFESTPLLPAFCFLLAALGIHPILALLHR